MTRTNHLATVEGAVAGYGIFDQRRLLYIERIWPSKEIAERELHGLLRPYPQTHEWRQRLTVEGVDQRFIERMLERVGSRSNNSRRAQIRAAATKAQPNSGSASSPKSPTRPPPSGASSASASGQGIASGNEKGGGKSKAGGNGMLKARLNANPGIANPHSDIPESVGSSDASTAD